MNPFAVTGRSWEQLWCYGRWMLILGAGAMLSDSLKLPLVLLAFAVVAASNLAFAAFQKMRSKNDPAVEMAGRGLRYFDGLLIAVASFLPTFAGEKLWLLAIPVVISEAMAFRSQLRTLQLAGAIGVGEVAAAILMGGSLPALWAPLSALGAGWAVGTVLARFKSREEVLHSRDRRLATVLQCGTAFAGSRDLKATILHALKVAVSETGATCGYVMLGDEEQRGPLVTEAAFSVDGEFEFPEVLDYGFGLSGYVAKMGQPVAVSDDAGEHRGFDGVTAGVKSAISLPLMTRGGTFAGKSAGEQALGVLTVLCTKRTAAFTGEDLDLLQALTSMISSAVSNARMEERQHATFVRTLESLATALEARDVYTQGHSQRVCEVSLLLGERMGFGPEAVEELRIGTVLHDIGKIGVPDEILNKRARLTDQEFAVMKQHPVIGYEICKPLMLSDGVLMIIRNHHEKLDGSGYPDGLKGGELPLSLRIVCVADAFDAMSSSRPYRGVMTQESVLAELSKCAGTQFDPVIVEALKELLHQEKMRELYSKHMPSEELKAA